MCTKDDGPNKINFIRLRSKSTKIIIETCNSFFTIKVGRETIVLKCDKSVKKREFITSAHFSCKNNVFMIVFGGRVQYDIASIYEI